MIWARYVVGIREWGIHTKWLPWVLERIVAQLVKKASAFYGCNFLFPVHRIVPLDCILNQQNPVYILTPYFRCMLILLFNLCSPFPNTSFLSGKRFNLCTKFLSTYVRASFHAHLIVSYFIIVTMCGEVKYLYLSVFSFLYSRFTSCLLCQNILLGTPFSSMFFM